MFSPYYSQIDAVGHYHAMSSTLSPKATYCTLSESMTTGLIQTFNYSGLSKVKILIPTYRYYSKGAGP